MMMKKLIPFLLLFVFMVGGCASSRPDWTDSGKSELYPPSRYLTGIGTATDLESAKDRARANLAKVFSASISEVTEDITRHASKSGSGGQQHINEERIERIISSRSEHVLTGSRIAETWQEQKTNTYYVLATISRLQAENNLLQEIKRLDNATRIYIKRAQKEGDILRKVRAASNAVDAQVARLAFQRKLRIVDTSGHGSPSKWQISKLNSDLERLLRRVRISPQVVNDTTGTLKTSATAALSTAGFKISGSKTAEFVLEARLDLESIGYRDDWYWSRGVLQVTLKERATGHERGSARWPLKAAGTSNKDAEQRIGTKVQSLLNLQLRDTIVKFATD
jgi:hypothetical protein